MTSSLFLAGVALFVLWVASWSRNPAVWAAMVDLEMETGLPQEQARLRAGWHVLQLYLIAVACAAAGAFL